ncbi:hypothetical protein ACFOLF_30920 [Paenibacillus sepulcri]|uniref:TcaA protein NTF2-like domain-containing protein n=1 Tax=Paenibacillus sepulcri TaxID=359917 RepID=A0ABS7C5E8_9BACL|nr:hypothetical protein [Paenibacillus sepulcri]
MYRIVIFCLLTLCLLLMSACDDGKTGAGSVNVDSGGPGKPAGYYAHEVMIAYEQSIIEAINKNKFSLVEGLLDEEGPLYQDQKKLVAHLNDKQVKEKLIRYEIRSIQGTNGVYKFYVVENTELYHPDRAPEVFEYEWVYTVKENAAKGEAKVYSIERWTR